MASVNLCDRCGVMVKGAALGAVQIRTSSDPDVTEVVTKEICPVCVEEILTLVEMDADALSERAKRGYDKPYVRPRNENSFDQATTEQMAAALLERLMKNQGRELETGSNG